MCSIVSKLKTANICIFYYLQIVTEILVKLVTVDTIIVLENTVKIYTSKLFRVNETL